MLSCGIARLSSGIIRNCCCVLRLLGRLSGDFAGCDFVTAVCRVCACVVITSYEYEQQCQAY